MYPLSMKQNFVVCHHVSLTNQGVPQVRKGRETLIESISKLPSGNHCSKGNTAANVQTMPCNLL